MKIMMVMIIIKKNNMKMKRTEEKNSFVGGLFS